MRSKGAVALAFSILLLAIQSVIAVRSDIRSVRYGTNLLQSRKAEKGNRSGFNTNQGRLLRQGTKLNSATSSGCKNVLWDDKVVVAAWHDEDVSWMAVYLTPETPFLIYSVTGDEEATHRTASNTGREAQAYIQFMVDYYECLPKYMAFIHAHRSSPHSPDILFDLKHLRWDRIPGFMSMSRPAKISLFYFKNPDLNKPDDGDNTETAKWSQFAYEQNINIKAHWEQLYLDEMGPIPDVLRSPNCGQFVVTKDRVRAHPKEFWQKHLDWMRSTGLDPFWAGLIYEHTWSYMLGAGVNYSHPLECDIYRCEANETRPWLEDTSESPGLNMTDLGQNVSSLVQNPFRVTEVRERGNQSVGSNEGLVEETFERISEKKLNSPGMPGSKRNVSISVQYRDQGRRPNKASAQMQSR